MSEQEDKVDISVKTPIGEIIAHGVRTNAFINLAALAGVVAISFFLWRITTVLQDHEAKTVAENKEIAIAITKWTKAMRLETCILAQSQEDRQKEFLNPNGWCKMMSEAP